MIVPMAAVDQFDDDDGEWQELDSTGHVVPIPETSDPADAAAARALRKGFICTAVIAFVLGLLMSWLCGFMPQLVIVKLHDDVQAAVVILAMNGIFGAAVAYILLAVMHRTSQMIGLPSTVIVILLSAVTMTIKHLVMAVMGVDASPDFPKGWEWMAPAFIAKANIGAWVGILLTSYFFREGESITELLGSG